VAETSLTVPGIRFVIDVGRALREGGQWHMHPTSSKPGLNRAFGLPSTQSLPAAYQGRRINQSPIDALINLMVRYGLWSQIPP
jgi:hypothetical protein